MYLGAEIGTRIFIRHHGTFVVYTFKQPICMKALQDEMKNRKKKNKEKKKKKGKKKKESSVMLSCVSKYIHTYSYIYI